MTMRVELVVVVGMVVVEHQAIVMKEDGGGGSGYINTSKLTEAFMYGYNVPTSNGTATKTYSTTNVSSTPTSNYVKSGDGAARITPIN